MLNQRLISGKNLTPISKENAFFNLLTGKLSLAKESYWNSRSCVEQRRKWEEQDMTETGISILKGSKQEYYTFLQPV